MKVRLEVNGADVAAERMVVTIVGENDFEILLLKMFDCSTPSFRYDGCELKATLEIPR